MSGKKAKRLRREARLKDDKGYLEANVTASPRVIRGRMDAMRAGLIEDVKTISAPSIRIKLNPNCSRAKYKELKKASKGGTL